MFNSKPLPWLIVAAVIFGNPIAVGEVLFEEDFNNQPDFTSTMHTLSQGQFADKGDILPIGWDYLYQGTVWSPETGYPDNHASLEILASNSKKARGGAGKSMVNWRESYDRGFLNWASDSQLIKVFDQQYKQLYVEFWISFSDNWYGRDNASDFSSKLFRVGSWSGEGDIFNGANGYIGPVFFWDYKRDTYGLRNALAFRGGPWGENYYMTQSEPKFDAFTSSNFGSDTAGFMPGGKDPQVVDQVNGGYLVDIDRYDFISHNQVFGPPGHWTKVAFYVQMNSAPDSTDGVMMQWINDQRIRVEDNIPWVKSNSENKMIGWNYVALGGNDYFQPYPNDQRFEDWYAIDDVVVQTSIPERLLAETPSAPNPPAVIGIQ